MTFSAAAAGQVPCDPAVEVCDPPDDVPPIDEPLPEDPVLCDPFIDPACAGDIPLDVLECDPFIDPTCLPPEFFDDPFFGDPFLCDPFIDPTCADDVPFDVSADPFVDAGVGADPLTPVGACDPFLDPSCAPPADLLDYCASVPDPICSLLNTEDPAPQALAFDEPAPAAPAAVVTRSDISDDVPPTELPAEDVPVVAANRLLLVVDALAELGAFQRTPDPDLTAALRQVREDIPADGLTEDGYRDEVRRLAADLPVYIDQMVENGTDVSPAIRALRDAFDEATLDALDAGDGALFDAAPIFAAIADLNAREGAEPENGRSIDEDITEVLGLSVLYAPPVETVAEVVPSTTTAPTTTTTPPTTTVAPPTSAPVGQVPVPPVPAAEDQGSLIGLWIGIGAAILLAASALIAVLRRNGGKTQLDGTGGNELVSVDDLLDASRRMTASLDSAEIVSIALGEARRLIDAEGGIVVMRQDDELEAVGFEPAHFFRSELAHEGALRRVVETGRSIATIATDEPVLVEVPVAVAAVSIVIDGRVAGAIMVVRIPSRPFDRQELEALEMLAPLVGSALNAAAAHDSATALVDVEPMTGLKNRRRLDRDMAELEPDDQVAYVMVDVDHFKNFNDVNGHAAGDEALRQVANALSESVRPGDVVYRYGGEEFCILLPGTTVADATVVAERARSTVEALDIPGGENQPDGRVTISVGVADTADAPLDDLIERADGALYEAKHGGRNQVCTAD